jgi:hypothetical protein
MDCACLHREAVALRSPVIGGAAAPPWETNKSTRPYAEGVTPHSPDVDAFRGAPWVTDDNTHGYPEGVLQEAAITMTPPSRLVKRLRRIGWMGTGNPGCAADHCCAAVPGVDPGLRDVTASR